MKNNISKTLSCLLLLGTFSQNQPQKKPMLLQTKDGKYIKASPQLIEQSEVLKDQKELCSPRYNYHAPISQACKLYSKFTLEKTSLKKRYAKKIAQLMTELYKIKTINSICDRFTEKTIKTIQLLAEKDNATVKQEILKLDHKAFKKILQASDFLQINQIYNAIIDSLPTYFINNQNLLNTKELDLPHTPHTDPDSKSIWDGKMPFCCQNTLIGHTNRVRNVIQLNDGRLVSCSDDQTLRVWTENNGTWTSVELTGHTSRVYNVIQLSDGRLVSCSDNQTLRVWTENNGTWTSVELTGHPSRAYNVIQLSDGRLVSCSLDNTLRVWTETNGIWTSSQQLTGHTDWVNNVIELRDGRLVSCSDDTNLHIWTETNGIWTSSQQLTDHTDGVNNVIELSDGRLVSYSYDNTLRIWTETNGTWTSQKLTGHTDWVNNVIELHDGRLVSCSIDNTLRIWTETNGIWTSSQQLTDHTSHVAKVIELSDGRLASCSIDNTLRIWSNKTSPQDTVDSAILKAIIGAAQESNTPIKLKSNGWAYKAWNSLPKKIQQKFSKIVKIDYTNWLEKIIAYYIL